MQNTEEKVVTNNDPISKNTEKQQGKKEKGIKDKIMAIIILLLILALLGGAYYVYTLKNAAIPESKGNFRVDTRETSEEIENPMADLASRNVYFAGIEDAVFAGSGQIALENLPENEDFFMRYQVVNDDTGETVFETDLITSGNRIYFDPYSELKPGIYHLSFVETPYALINGEYIELTGASNPVTITLQ